MINLLRERLRGRYISPALARLVPRAVKSFGPPRDFGPACKLAAGAILATEPPESIPRPRLTMHGRGTDDGLGPFRNQAPANVVFSLDEASLRDRDGHVVTGNDELVFDAGFWSRLYDRPGRDHSLYQMRKRLPRRRLPGLTISLASDFVVGGYGHFVHDSLSRLRLLRMAGVEVNHADWIFCPRMASPTVNALCEDLGFDPDKLINHQPGLDFECERLIATTYPSAIGSIAPRDALFLEELGRRWRGPGQPNRRIYLSRAGFTRNFDNEPEVLAILRRHGFEIIDPACGQAALAACANASVIAGIDGANLSSLAFAPASARVLVIYPEQAPPQPYQITLAASAGRDVHVFAPAPSGARRRAYIEGFSVRPDEFDDCLSKVCAGLPLPRSEPTGPAPQ